MANQDLRDAIERSGVTYKAVARQAGLSAEHLCRLMAKPLSQVNRIKILDALGGLVYENRDVKQDAGSDGHQEQSAAQK